MESTRPNPFEVLERSLRQRFPDAVISSDPSELNDGVSFLDMTLDGHLVAIQWKPSRGFGISCSKTHYYGEGADEVYPDEESTYGRVVSLVLSRSYTSPPESIRLAELRRERGISQVQLAESLDVRQAAISKLERRNDLLVSSVRDVVRSMGGELTIVAKFPDGMERALRFDDGSASDLD